MLLVFLAFLQDPDADALLKKLEDRLVAAKTLQVEMKGETVFTKGKESAKAAMAGTLKIKAPAKYAFAGTMERGEEKIAASITSDGEVAVEKAGDVVRTLKPVKDFGERAGALFARFGFVPAQVLRLRNEDVEPQEKDADFLPDARKLVKVEGAKARAVKGGTVITAVAVYRRYGEEGDTRVEVTLELGEDGLPVKRVMKLAQEAVTIEVTESYSAWKIDAEIDDSTFTVK
jgi:outer membrane lipoprotein-sorting protein